MTYCRETRDKKNAVRERVNPKQTGYCMVHHGPGEVKWDLIFGPIVKDR